MRHCSLVLCKTAVVPFLKLLPERKLGVVHQIWKHLSIPLSLLTYRESILHRQYLCPFSTSSYKGRGGVTSMFLADRSTSSYTCSKNDLQLLLRTHCSLFVSASSPSAARTAESCSPHSALQTAPLPGILLLPISVKSSVLTLQDCRPEPLPLTDSCLPLRVLFTCELCPNIFLFLFLSLCLFFSSLTTHLEKSLNWFSLSLSEWGTVSALCPVKYLCL